VADNLRSARGIEIEGAFLATALAIRLPICYQKHASSATFLCVSPTQN